ncbi:MAG: translesion DNA synthesis-associated protein ImuA [Hylemonella sp.]|uniref:translesion DNA synthesis-associated protein ImuA n=1 Tax=Hylemonella sp. TaxID=2066020 RepID=UPI0022CB4486|nr:translesion DNA synthesis-associated protein ImuA [Hylemonella sp.]MCZ8252435.1 translesion DNA synthesis-associated protein ImuA [Hylemonella sp.]
MAAVLRSLQAPPSPDELAGVWRADQLARTPQAVLPSGHAALDAELPGGGWPLGQLTEILQAQSGQHEWRLLLPALQAAAQRGPLVLVGAPHLPHLPVLAALGIAPDRVLRIEARTPAERLWAAEQALRCKDIGALLAWLPQVRSEQLRRLQLSGNTSQALVFAMRPLDAQRESSPAPLRLAVQCGEGTQLALQLLKRRGPPRDQPLALDAPLPVLAALKPVRRRTTETDHAVDRPARARIRQLTAA